MRIVPSVALALCAGLLIPTTPEDRIARARAFYRSQPRALQPVLGEPKVANLPNIRADHCGTCHAEIYAEWKASPHARPLESDARLRAGGNEHSGTNEADDTSWTCVNCHSPFESQLKRLVVGLESGQLGRPQYVDNPNYDARLQLEAITCATCHVRDGVIVGPYGNTVAPHPVKKAEFLAGSELCLDCHRADMRFESPEFGCSIDTGFDSPPANEAANDETCQSCHMPQIDRSVANVPVTPKRKSRRHTFGGSLIPKSEELRKDTQRMRAFHEDGLTLEWIDAPASIVRGTRVTLKFAASNARAGHRLPAGDLERHLLLDFELKSNDGRVLASKQEYIGVKYEWRAPTKLSDTRLARGERREYEVEFTPSEAGAFTLSLRASKWRLDPKSLADRGTSTRVVAGIPFLSLERPIDVTDS